MTKRTQDETQSGKGRVGSDSPQERTDVLASSPANLLGALRGAIVNAQLAHPGVLNVEINDASGGVWRLATQDATWSPAAHEQLVGLRIERAQVDGESGGLRCDLSDGAALTVTPSDGGSSGDLPAWELISPSGVSLECGPGLRWAVSQARS